MNDKATVPYPGNRHEIVIWGEFSDSDSMYSGIPVGSEQKLGQAHSWIATYIRRHNMNTLMPKSGQELCASSFTNASSTPPMTTI